MRFVGLFNDIHNTVYKIVFGTSGDVVDIELAASPAIIEYTGSDDIYKPLKLSGATITIVSSSPLFDLYSHTAQGIKAQLYRVSDNKIVWQGYVTPCVYSQDYAELSADIEIECVDCLSSLADIKYSPSQQKVRSFIDILFEAIERSGMTLGSVIVDDAAFDLTMKVSDLNWVDEDGEQSTYKEVIEEILKFSHMTMFQCFDSVYIINYDRLISSPLCNVYAPDKTVVGSVQLNITIIDEIYSGAQISLSEVLNNFTAIGSPYSVEELIKDPMDPAMLGKRMFDGECTYTAVYTGFSSGAKAQEWTHKVVHFDNINPNITLYQYAYDGSVYTGIHSPANQQNYFAAWQIKSWGYDSGAIKDVGYPTSKDFKYYLGVRVANLDYTRNRGNATKLISIKSEIGSAGVYPESGFLSLSADCMFVRTNQTPAKFMYFPEYVSRLKLEGKISTVPHFLAVIKLGDKYYNGKSWVNTASSVKVEVGKVGDIQIFTWHPVKNTNDYRNGVDDLEGYIIPLPAFVSTGELEVTIYTPYIDNWQIDHVFMRNIKLDIAYKKNETEAYTDKEFNYDNKYSDSVDGGARPGEDIDLMITTWDKSSYSKAAPISGSIMLDSFRGQKQEYNIIDSYINQYRKPNKLIEVEIDGILHPFDHVSDDPDKFIINGCTIDVLANTTTLNLVQKR